MKIKVIFLFNKTLIHLSIAKKHSQIFYLFINFLNIFSLQTKAKKEQLSKKLEQLNEYLTKHTNSSITWAKSIDWKTLKTKRLKNYLYILLCGAGLFTLAQFNNDSKIIYNDLFSDYLPKNLVTSIKIRKSLQYIGYYTMAEVHLIDGRVKYLEIGNLDDFLLKLTASQENSAQKVTVEMGMELGWLQFFDKYYQYFNMTLMVFSLYLFISILKRSDIMRGGGGDVLGVGIN
jgi:hypothetical protein